MAAAKTVMMISAAVQFEVWMRIAIRGRLFTGRIEASVIRSIQRPFSSRC
jgi:hypothetical protein